MTGIAFATDKVSVRTHQVIAPVHPIPLGYVGILREIAMAVLAVAPVGKCECGTGEGEKQHGAEYGRGHRLPASGIHHKPLAKSIWLVGSRWFITPNKPARHSFARAGMRM